MNYSKKREIILRALKDNPIHPTAEQLYAIVKKIDNKISLATVYRNLNMLADNGEIKKISSKYQTSHFDHNTHKHYHFTCRKCKSLYDIDNNITPDFVNNAEAETGLIIEDYDISFYGICHNCQTKN